MAVWYDKEREHWCARASGRHPITKKPSNLVRICLKTKSEAQRMEKKLIKQLQEKFSEAVHPMFEDVVEENLESMQKESNVGAAYILEKRQTLEKHAIAPWQLKRIDQITTVQIRDVIIDADCSVGTKKKIKKFVNQVFEFAVEAGYLNRNPCPKLTFKTNLKMFPVLNEEELKIFLREAKARNHPWYYIWAVAVHSGMRSGELYAAELSCVSMQRNLIHVCRGLDRVNGIQDYTKGKYDRLIEISPPLKKIFKELLKERQGEEFLLPRIKEWDQGRQAAVLREFLDEIGLPSIRFHDIRASWCTLLLSKNVPPAQVMLLGGWKDWKTFQRYIRKAGINIRGATKVLSCLED